MRGRFEQSSEGHSAASQRTYSAIVIVVIPRQGNVGYHKYNEQSEIQGQSVSKHRFVKEQSHAYQREYDAFNVQNEGSAE
jgi:hypothetical protein